jgi:hypothetical protein
LSSGYPSARVFLNIVGGSLTLLSVQLPWVVINRTFPISIQQGPLYQLAFYWILAGAILSFLSRFGAILTFIGLLAFTGEPYWSFGFSTLGQGLLLAIAGGILSFAGARWAIPKTLIRGREMIGGAVYSVGFLIILTLVISSYLYSGFLGAPSEGQLIVEVPLFLVGVLMTGLGLRMFLLPERRDKSVQVLDRST